MPCKIGDQSCACVDDSDDVSSVPTSHETLVTGQRLLTSQLCFFVEVRHLHLHGWLPALVSSQFMNCLCYFNTSSWKIEFLISVCSVIGSVIFVVRTRQRNLRLLLCQPASLRLTCATPVSSWCLAMTPTVTFTTCSRDSSRSSLPHSSEDVHCSWNNYQHVIPKYHLM